MRVLAGSLAGLSRPGTVTAPDWSGLKPGDTVRMTFADGRSERLRVVAVVADLRLPSLLLPAATVRAHDPSALADAVYVRAGNAAATEGAVTGLPVVVRDRAAYTEAVGAEDERAGLLVLTILLGVALTFTRIAIVNTLLMATTGRAAELRLLRLSGATPVQILRVVAGETVLVVAVGTGLALAATVLSLHGLTSALGKVTEVATMAVPWAAIGTGAGVCLLLAATASVGMAGVMLRRPSTALSG